MTRSPLATPADVANYLHTTVASLAQQRYKGTGPKYFKDGKRVLYRWSDIEAYIEARLMSRTDDRPGAA
ncbi:helix-turn-helix domain-containing protein [Rhodococcus ruber]|uniref:helix-turn-helix transcriptional regulator n=1 Tax=Rhodococcus ruber TaxID=1830 RepID=UPI001933E996|nr:helix-turn-helix domain-containing protein [Rhodococcus ruber]QRE79156.1 helix-turn-helix domain-containing protein [Rhodococcus ruber]